MVYGLTLDDLNRVYQRQKYPITRGNVSKNDRFPRVIRIFWAILSIIMTVSLLIALPEDVFRGYLPHATDVHNPHVDNLITREGHFVQ